MPVRKLLEFLDAENVKYVTIDHSPAFTAQETAARAHVPGQELAKTVMVKIDGKLAMAVVPASCRVDFEMLKVAAGASEVELAKENDFRDTFPDCDLGAMPPFGNLYDIPVFVAEKLAEDKEIAFNACSHTRLIRMSFKDYKRLVKPKVASFTLVPVVHQHRRPTITPPAGRARSARSTPGPRP